MNTKILEEVGLTGNEIKVYLALLELGSVTAGDILKKIELHRGAVYDTLDKLIDKGLVSYFIKNNVTSGNTRFTNKCIKDVHAQIKKKEIKLTLNHSDVEIGELVACSIDKNGLRGSFVLYPDHPLFFKIVCGIAFKVFKGWKQKKTTSTKRPR